MQSKKLIFKKKLKSIIFHHYKNCEKYKKILKFLDYNPRQEHDLKDQPFLPVNIFKEQDLISVPNNKIYKVLNSSGTTNNKLSKIYLDRENSYNQIKALSSIMVEVLGKNRIPMLIIDSFNEIKDRFKFNAKIAAINGFSIFGKNHTYLLKEDKTIDYELLNSFLSKYGDKPFFIFGFTFNIYESLIMKLNSKKVSVDFSKGIILHGGGWKKMENLKINSKELKKRFKDKINIKNIYNYYGLIEQTGSIFLECQNCNCFRTNKYSEIIIRDKNLNILPPGKKGFVQLFSLLPTSYPGHIILTEDVGEIVENNKNCQICKDETKFLIHGRFAQSIVRGCSDA